MEGEEQKKRVALFHSQLVNTGHKARKLTYESIKIKVSLFICRNIINYLCRTV